MKVYNTLTREKEEFIPIHEGQVGFYSCGPTVYDYAHIGNLRAYIFADILQKTLEYSGYKVKRVMNITDIGHLTSDADEGEDKMVKGLKREGKPFTLEGMKELAVFYKEKFMEDLARMNIKTPDIVVYASDHIKENVEMIKVLMDKGYAYKTESGIYFEIAKFPDYWNLSGGKPKNEDNAESRISENKEKKNQADFVLWKLSKPDELGYDTEIGKGFPGWHIECSAMSIKYLGEQFDVHTGGIDHIPVHHPNEIAQSEAYSGKKPFVKYWMHNEHLDLSNGVKMAKSGDGFITLKTVQEHNVSPLGYRFWLLMGSYRTKMNFNWEALTGAETALKRLYGIYLGLGADMSKVHEGYKTKFIEHISDDLDTPGALALLWDLVKDDSVSNADKKATLLDFDKVLGLGLADLKDLEIPEEVKKLGEEYDKARKEKDFKKSDELKSIIEQMHGYKIEQGKDTYKIRRYDKEKDSFKRID